MTDYEISLYDWFTLSFQRVYDDRLVGTCQPGRVCGGRWAIFAGAIKGSAEGDHADRIHDILHYLF